MRSFLCLFSLQEIKKKEVGEIEDENNTHIIEKHPLEAEKPNSTALTIIELLKKDPKITYDTLSQKTGKSKITVRRYVEKLVCEGKINREGGKKYGKWVVCSSENEH